MREFTVISSVRLLSGFFPPWGDFQYGVKSPPQLPVTAETISP